MCKAVTIVLLISVLATLVRCLTMSSCFPNRQLGKLLLSVEGLQVTLIMSAILKCGWKWEAVVYFKQIALHCVDFCPSATLKHGTIYQTCGMTVAQLKTMFQLHGKKNRAM